MTKPLALTLGEPAGIGPDIAIAAWLKRRELDLPPFYLIGDIDFMKARAKVLNAAVSLTAIGAAKAAATFANALPVVPLELSVTSRPESRTTQFTCRHRFDPPRCRRCRRRACRRGRDQSDCEKRALQGGFRIPGHTEFLAHLAAKGDKAPTPVMMLWSPSLAVVPVTIHLSLRDAIANLSSDLIVKTARIVAADLKSRFGIAAPRLAISGLNPHAGEDGSLGQEDQSIVAPAIAALRAEGIDVRGPLPADTMFHERARKTYDCAICMYHDQALIPIKTIAFDDGVNVTLGLPFIRTSPDHGTAFDIAGTGKANPSSLIAALKLAARMASRAG